MRGNITELQNKGRLNSIQLLLRHIDTLLSSQLNCLKWLLTHGSVQLEDDCCNFTIFLFFYQYPVKWNSSLPFILTQSVLVAMKTPLFTLSLPQARFIAYTSYGTYYLLYHEQFEAVGQFVHLLTAWLGSLATYFVNPVSACQASQPHAATLTLSEDHLQIEVKSKVEMEAKSFKSKVASSCSVSGL